MGEMDPKVIVAKLNNTNYQLWKFKVELILSKHDLWDGMFTEKPMSSETSPNTEEILKWEKLDRKARANIGLLVEDDQLIHIRDCATAKAMWIALQNVHERSTLNSKLYLLRKLYGMRLVNGQSMQTHISTMLEIVAQLRGMRKDFQDNDVAALLLCSLPESYSSLITALEARPEDEITLEYVKGKLIDEYQRRQENVSSEEFETALHTGNRKINVNNQYVRRCLFCNKSGHVQAKCFKWKAEQKKKKFDQKANSVVEEDKTEVNNVDQSATSKEHTCFKANTENGLDRWIVDSGATSHMTNNKHFFTKLNSDFRDKVCIANGKYVEVTGIGDGILKCMLANNKVRTIQVKDVLYVPDLDSNLLSVMKLTKKGFQLHFKDNKCTILLGDDIFAVAMVNSSLYTLCQVVELANATKYKEHSECIHKWHRRFGHRDPSIVEKVLKEDMVTGFLLKPCMIDVCYDCSVCIKGKMIRKSFPKSVTRASRPGELIHSDVCGPMQNVTPGGAKYYLTFIDDYSRYCKIFLLKAKDEVETCIRFYIAELKTKYGRAPEVLRTDGGGEYIGKSLKHFLRKEGIRHQMTAPHCPEQNGVAERKNRSLSEMARCLLLDAGMHKRYWGEAIMTANYLQNRLPTAACQNTPFEMWTGSKPDISCIKIFGSKSYVHVPDMNRRKLDDKALEGILVGYCEERKAYRILNPDTNKIWISRDVKFEECNHIQECNQELDSSVKNSLSSDVLMQPINETVEVELGYEQVCDDITKEDTIRETILPRCSNRSTKGIPPPRLAYKAVVEPNYEPESWTEMLNLGHSEKSKWLKAVAEEMESLQEKNIWELTTLPPNKKAIGCKWVFKQKQDEKGLVNRYKARLVAKGYTQKYGCDFEETFAPVTKLTTIRILLTIAAIKKMRIKHLDVKTAFLNGDIAEELYMEQADGFVKPGEEDLVYKLKKGIYGLKQSARAWNTKINDVLVSHGYEESNADPCLFVKNLEGVWCYIALYVDDLLVCSVSEDMIAEAVKNLNSSSFETKDLGDVKYYLGIQIERKEDGLFLIHQSTKIKQLIHVFGLDEAKNANTPMDVDYMRLTGEDDLMSTNVEYRKAVGALLHIATCSRPDITAAVCVLSRRVSKPRERDWIAVKRVMRYLKLTLNFKLQLGDISKQTGIKLTGFVDADWAGDHADRKSTSGFVFQINGSTVSWSSKKQQCVALSTTEAEFIAASLACQEVVWIRQLIADLGCDCPLPIPIFEDNQGCISLARTEKCSQRTKHIDIKVYHLRDQQDSGLIDLIYCPTEVMIADILTKPLIRGRFEDLLSNLNIGNYD